MKHLLFFVLGIISMLFIASTNQQPFKYKKGVYFIQQIHTGQNFYSIFEVVGSDGKLHIAILGDSYQGGSSSISE